MDFEDFLRKTAIGLGICAVLLIIAIAVIYVTARRSLSSALLAEIQLPLRLAATGEFDGLCMRSREPIEASTGDISSLCATIRSARSEYKRSFAVAHEELVATGLDQAKELYWVPLVAAGVVIAIAAHNSSSRKSLARPVARRVEAVRTWSTDAGRRATRGMVGRRPVVRYPRSPELLARLAEPGGESVIRELARSESEPIFRELIRETMIPALRTSARSGGKIDLDVEIERLIRARINAPVRIEGNKVILQNVPKTNFVYANDVTIDPNDLKNLLMLSGGLCVVAYASTRATEGCLRTATKVASK